MTTPLIQEAIEAAATQDLCGNHNSADLLRRLARELEAERGLADALVRSLAYYRGTAKWSLFNGPDILDNVLAAHAKRREAGE